MGLRKLRRQADQQPWGRQGLTSARLESAARVLIQTALQMAIGARARPGNQAETCWYERALTECASTRGMPNIASAGDCLWSHLDLSVLKLVQGEPALSPRNTPGRARKRRLDFTGAEESPSLVHASYASKLDMLAAAASEAAGKPQTPATSNDTSHDDTPGRRYASMDLSYESKRSPAKRSRADANLLGFPSPGIRPRQFLSPGAHRRGLLSPTARSLGLASPNQLGVDDLHPPGMAVDLQGDLGQQGFLDLLRGQNGMDDLRGNLSELGSPFGTPSSHLQVCPPSSRILWAYV